MDCLPYAPWLGINPEIFWCAGLCSNQLSHLASLVFNNRVLLQIKLPTSILLHHLLQDFPFSFPLLKTEPTKHNGKLSLQKPFLSYSNSIIDHQIINYSIILRIVPFGMDLLSLPNGSGQALSNLIYHLTSSCWHLVVKELYLKSWLQTNNFTYKQRLIICLAGGFHPLTCPVKNAEWSISSPLVSRLLNACGVISVHSHTLLVSSELAQSSLHQTWW